MHRMKTYIINSRNDKEIFSFHKVLRSAKRSGASLTVSQHIAKQIEKEVYPGIKTSEIFKRIKELLSKKTPQVALKFSLREAMNKLGPTGFPFEEFIKGILINNGFEVKINQYISGVSSISYEIDFLATKGKLIYIGECKYRNMAGERVDIKVALYNYARFLDIKNNSYFKKLQANKFRIKSMLVTNTKFTTYAIKYSEYQKTELLGWKYPLNKGLEYFIEKDGLYPITILPSLKGGLKNIFIQEGIMLAKDLLDLDIDLFSKNLNIPKKYILPLIDEAKILLK
ncbi:hypothetical protein KJ671_00490 [Patescibacteria group bacterium]|nr:hypothetical protein [Patescibacteria group bacterium]